MFSLVDLSVTSWIGLSILSLITLIYWRFTQTFNYWTKRNLNGPRPYPFGGTNLYTFVKSMPAVELEWYKKFGPLYGVFNKTEPILTVAKPELIKTILVKDFHLFTDRRTRPAAHHVLDKNLFHSRGEDWKRYRSIMSPTFTSGKMRKMYPMIRECLNEFLDVLDVSAANGADINLKDMHGNFTMDVIARCAFATKTNSHKDCNNPFVVNGQRVFNPILWRQLPLFLLPGWALTALGIRSGATESAHQFFLQTTQHVIRQRKAEQNGGKHSKKYNDFIQLLVDAERDKDELHDENDANEAHHVNEGEEELAVERKTLSGNILNKQLTETEIMAQGWIIFVAGYETTATTLTFCSYELALNPEVQERLHQEVMASVDANGEISYEELSKLPYLDAVLSETLRLYPPVLRLERKSVSDNYQLGDTGVRLYAGQPVEIPVYAIHHSDEYYEKPDTFNPDRFLPQNRHKITPYTYLPFGAGPRNCIGMRFALMEAKLGLLQILQRFRFFRSPQTAVPLEFKTITRLIAAKTVIVGIEKR